MTEEYESLLRFLEPFTQGTEGYIGITKVDRPKDPDKNKVWGSYANLYVETDDGEVNLPFEVLNANPKWEWYFTPAVLSEQSRVQTKFQHSNVVWIDFDEYVDWEAMDPAPSIVVGSSKGKFHCYWLLEEPITDVHDMRYWCKRFLTHFDDIGDKSGFDATQLLRLPWGLNLKLSSANDDGTPFAPTVLKFDTELRYTEDSFSSMPEPEMDMPQVVDNADLPNLPEVTKPWTDYYNDYDEDLPESMYRRISNPKGDGEEKRSGELYAVTGALVEALDDTDKVFQLLYKSPLDKFSADNGATRGAYLLWKDLNRIAAKIGSKKANADSKQKIQDILSDRGSARDKGIQVSDFVKKELREKGEFLHSTEGEFFYADMQNSTPHLYSVGTNKDSPFAGSLSTRYGINAGVDSSILVGLLHDLLYECQTTTPIPFYHFAHYDILSNVVYVDRYDSTMYVLDGETVTHQPHGYNGIYFHKTQDNLPQPYEYVTKYQTGGLEALVLDGPNYTVHGKNISLKQVHHILKTWVATFFFPTKMTTKPIVLIHGEPDSGKTTLFRNLSAMLTGDSSYSVTDMPTDIKEFNVLVSQNPYIFLDNVNVNSKQMQEKLAQAATGYVAKNRTLHTNKDVTNLRARAFIGITSFTLDKIQKDVTQRYVILPVHPFLADRNYKRKALSNILEDVATHRNELWSELLDYVNKIVATIGMHGLQATDTQLRMADYVAFLQLTSDMVGLDYTTMEDFILRMQSETMQENDPIFSAIKKYLATGPDFNQKFTGKALYELLCRMDRKFPTTYKSHTKFTSALKSHIASNTMRFSGIGIEVTPYSKTSRYRVYPLEFEGVTSGEEEDQE